MKLHLENNIVEGTPEELAKYTELLEGGNKDNQLFCYGHAHRPDEDTLEISTDEADCSQVKDIKPTYKIVNKDTIDYISRVRIFKGIVLKHVVEDRYIDTAGNHYILDDKDLVDYNMSWIDDKFKSHKDKSLLLVQKEEFKEPLEEDVEDKYFVVTRNVKSLFKSFVPDKGTVLKKLDKHGYRDTLGKTYLLSKGTVLKKLDKHEYKDTLGKTYLLSGDMKDISKEPGIERLFEQAVGEKETLVYSI